MLASKTTNATEEIAKSIESIQSETGLAVNRMDLGMASVSDGVNKGGACWRILE